MNCHERDEIPGYLQGSGYQHTVIMSSSQDTYVSNTSPLPYHQIIVLSQKVINAGFKNMWKLAQGDLDTPLKHFKKTIHGEYIDSDVGVPSVEIHVESREPMLYFLLSLTKGKLAVYSSDTSDDLLKWDIKDWVLAFNVVISEFRGCFYSRLLVNSYLLSNRPEADHQRLGNVQGVQRESRASRIQLFSCAAVH